MNTDRLQSSLHNRQSTIINPQSASENWQVVAASVAGVSHVRIGLPCQDAHAYHLLENGVLIAAVADGAGSAARGQEGAAIAVEVAVQTLKCRLQASSEAGGSEAVAISLRQSLEAARVALETRAEAQGEALRELATTLIVAVAGPEGVAVAQVGDGASVALEADGTIFALTTPPDAEYANATTFLTSPDALETAQIVIREQSVSALALFSDGLQRLALKLPEGTPHVPFFTPLFRFAAESHSAGVAEQQLTSFLRSPRITDRADDDLTLLIATHLPGS